MIEILSILAGLIILFLVCSLFYLCFGWFKFLYHDALGWHEPAKDAEQSYNGCNIKSTCKYCGKEVLQDSQGNWFEV